MNDKDKIIELQDKVIKLQEELALPRASQPAPYIITYPTYPIYPNYPTYSPNYTWRGMVYTNGTQTTCCADIASKLAGENK